MIGPIALIWLDASPAGAQMFTRATQRNAASVNKNWLKLGAAPLHGRHERRYFHEVGTRAGDEDDLEHLRSRNQLELRITLSNGQKAVGATLHDSVRSVPPHRQEFQRRYRSEQDHAVESSHDA